MKNKNYYFKLFACCVPVSGSKRAAIFDLQRGTFDTIPISLFEILDQYKNVQFSKILSKFGEKNEKTINEFFDWLIKREFGFWCKSRRESLQFPEMNLEWDTPFDLSNAIIDLNPNSAINYHKAIGQIIGLGVPHLQLRAYSSTEFNFYTSLLDICHGSRIKTIDILTPYIDNIDIDYLKKICREYLLINSITFHSAPYNKCVDLLDGLTKLIYSENHIHSSDCCGIITSSHFTINTMLFSESQKYNTCLNRKISIDVNGEIKNCPSMREGFGNIKNTTLQDALNNTGFKKYWNINKDKINICKDCEFRHICTDCRVYLENPDDIYSKPLKCGYNPYTATWEEWSSNPLKQNAIEHYHSTF
jgi:SPASM domain peptide maturase of grasp-with-spasm system